MFRRAVVAIALAVAVVAGAHAEKYEKPDVEKIGIDPEDLAKFKEAYTFYLEGVNFERDSEWASASQAYRQAIKIYPNYAEAQYGFGRMALRLDRLDEAEMALIKALSLDPELKAAHSDLGTVHYRRGEYNKAALEFKDALKANPEDIVARYNLANAFRNLDKPGEAIEQYEKTLAKDPAYVDCYFNMGLAYEDMGKSEEAVASFEKFVEAAKDDPEQKEWIDRAKEYIKDIREGSKGQ